MATKITASNYSTTLKQSTQGRAGSPNGNVFFDLANNTIELIGVDELATFDHTSIGGGANDANQLGNATGITLRALYNFIRARRSADETLRGFKPPMKGTFKFAGAYDFIHGVKLDDTVLGDGTTDRNKIRDSGWTEYAEASEGETLIDRVYYGLRSNGSIQSDSQPYYALVADTAEATLQAATWTNTKFTGPVNEAVQVFGSTANGDTNAGNFDNTGKTLVLRLRTWGYYADQVTSDIVNLAGLSGYSEEYVIDDTVHSTITYALADVFGGSQVSPWTGMTLEKLATPQTETGFTTGSADFTWVLNNTAGGSLAQCIAYLDAVAMQDSDIDAGTGTYNGRKGRVWYYRDPETGKIVTTSSSGEGLFIENLPLADRQYVEFTDDAAARKKYPFYPTVEITVGALAKADTNAWYHVFYWDGASTADFDTANAVTVNDASSNPVKGLCSTADASNKVAFTYDYTSNNQAGLTPNTDKDMIVLVESYGAGSVAQELTRFTVTQNDLVSVVCSPKTDFNV